MSIYADLLEFKAVKSLATQSEISVIDRIERCCCLCYGS